MRKTTDLAKIREKTIELLYNGPMEYNEKYDILYHCFASSRYVRLDDGTPKDLLKKGIYKQWAKKMEQRINDADIGTIFYVLVREPYVLNWVWLMKDYMSLEDFSEYYSTAWQMVEYPNANGESLPILLQFFKEADPRIMMNEEEYATWSNLPDEVVLYRGIAGSGNKYGLSWTLSIDTARWFKERYEDIKEQGTLLIAKVPKKYCLCYFNRREEQEIILDTSVRIVQRRIEEFE